ncbi:MAG: MMPL family transporter [Planctomycetes bacterium]|nr:MMPL family transporter [Planctomycetota bacterium]
MTRYRRRFFWTLAAMALLLPAVAPAAAWSLAGMYTSPSDWAPASQPERKTYEWFVQSFEREDAIIVGWPGATIDDPALTQLEESLAGVMTARRSREAPRLFARVFSGRSLVQEMTSPPLDLSTEAAVRRLQGTLIGDDGRSTTAVVVLSEFGSRERQAAIEIVRREAAQAAGLPPEEIRLAGDPVVAAVIDQESLRTLRNYIVPSVVVSLLLCWWRLRSWQYTLAIVIAAGFGEAAVLAFIYYAGMTMNAVLIVMPPLIFVLVVSSGVHLVNYYLDEVRTHGPSGAAQRAMAIGWAPCWMATITTALGMGSLLVSEIDPIRIFGLLSAAGLTVTVGILFLLLPGAMERWPFHSPYEHHKRSPRMGGLAPSTEPPTWGTDEEEEDDPDELSPLTHHFQRWQQFAEYVTHHGWLIFSVSLAAMIVAGVGLTRLHTSVDVRALFAPDSRVLADVQWLEQQIGPLTPVEAIVHFSADCPLTMPQRLRVVDAVQHEIGQLDVVGGVMSAITFAPPNLDRPPRGTFARSRHYAALQAAQRRFQEANFLAEDDGRQSWRVSARVGVDEHTDYAEYLGRIRGAAEPVLEYAEQELGARDLELTLTGVVPLSDIVHRVLLDDLFKSFLTALALVWLVMIVTLRSLGAGLVAMLPNVFPMVIVFGSMGWADVPIDIGTVMTASIALGIAVDGTLHFLTWFRRETAEGATREEAVHKTFRHCARAMTQSSLICGLGLLVFCLSGFLPTQRFAWMIACLLLAALVGDLLFLPAMLVGPVGRIFIRTAAPKASENGEVRERT